MGDHRLAFVVGQPGQGRPDRVLLPAQGGVLGPLGLARVDQARLVRRLRAASRALEATRLRAVTMA